MPMRTIWRELSSDNREMRMRGLRRLTRALGTDSETGEDASDREQKRETLCDKGCEALLLQLSASDEPAERELAADALAAWRGDNALQRLLKMTEDNEGKVRATALGALAMWPGHEEAYELLLMALEDSEWLVRMRAARALTVFEGVDAEQALLVALVDPDSFVRSSAADALRHRPPERILEGMRALFDHPAPHVLDAAFDLFGDVGVEEDRRFLAKVGSWTNLSQPGHVKGWARDAARRIKTRLSAKAG